MQTEIQLKAEHLTKRFGGETVLDGIDFAVRKGEAEYVSLDRPAAWPFWRPARWILPCPT